MNKIHKKLSKKHFRYLRKKEIRNPLIYLNNLYNRQTDFFFLYKETDLFLQAGLDPRLKIRGVDNGYISQRFIKQIEIAYVFYVSLHLDKERLSSEKLKSSRECYEYLRRTKNAPIYVIHRFFEVMSLKRWREEVDYITCIACNELESACIDSHDDALLIYVNGIQLVQALHQIYEDGGLKIDLPEYIKLQNKEDLEEGTCDRRE